MELIDKQKLLEWLQKHISGKAELIMLSTGTEQAQAEGFRLACITVEDKVNSGTFDNHSAQEHLIQVEQEKRDLNVKLLEGDRIIEDAWKKLGQAEQERDEWKAAHDRSGRLIKKWKERVRLADRQEIRAKRAEQERDALLERLKWYADDRNYEELEAEFIPIREDCGERARSIIAKIDSNGRAKRQEAEESGL